MQMTWCAIHLFCVLLLKNHDSCPLKIKSQISALTSRDEFGLMVVLCLIFSCLQLRKSLGAGDPDGLLPSRGLFTCSCNSVLGLRSLL